MPIFKVDIDPESYKRLTAIAVKERRPIPWQAEVLLIGVLRANLKDPGVVSSSEYGGYWIDYRHVENPLHGATRRWMETLEDFQADLVQLSTPPFAVMAFGFKTVPPPINFDASFLLAPA